MRALSLSVMHAPCQHPPTRPSSSRADWTEPACRQAGCLALAGANWRAQGPGIALIHRSCDRAPQVAWIDNYDAQSFGMPRTLRRTDRAGPVMLRRARICSGLLPSIGPCGCRLYWLTDPAERGELRSASQPGRARGAIPVLSPQARASTARWQVNEPRGQCWNTFWQATSLVHRSFGVKSVRRKSSPLGRPDR